MSEDKPTVTTGEDPCPTCGAVWHRFMPSIDLSMSPEACAVRACAGLDLPADVPEGAVTRLVEAARAMVGFQHTDQISELSGKLWAALRDLTGESK